MTFSEFNLHDDLLAGVDAMNYLNATPVQEMAIPKILAGRDLIASAQTGTGKTAAYLIPLLDKISHADHDHTSTLILVPTRELAKQIDEQVEGFGYFVNANSIAIYGGGKGDDWDKQRKALETGADIIIATPGRLMAHMQLGYVNFDRIDYLVLDEADKMLDMGFSDDIMNIVDKIPAKRQTLLFSATMPNKIREFSKRLLTEPEEIRLAVSKPAAGIDQQFYLAFDNQKLPLLAHLIKNSPTPVQSMVLFTSRKSEVNGIVRALSKLNYEARGISSDLEQDDREVVLRDFKNKAFPILVATDVLSRGIDIDNLTHVVNYDIPRDAEDYVHRIGRTARAATTGTAITFISDQDQNRITNIEKLIEREVEKRSVTEELGMGRSPVFDPKRFSGLRGKGGPSAGRGGRDGGGSSRGSGSGEGGRGRDGRRSNENRRSGNGTAPSEDRRNTTVNGERQPRTDVAPPSVEPTVTGVESGQQPRAVGVDGTASDKPKRRKKRRRGPKNETGETDKSPVVTPLSE
ncbi:superfamily II DNA/RNA helicase [Spirosoma sp. LMG 31448]|uniref:Superfamily II DNA/RNA helicase n=2 Tax=Spirosoma utsteinense TaxID=2585773 RepID=A0ABR6WCE6_9BACT|nr:superfamily II DNA/RNA helicase [Spirosoma utsteinense]MBC3793954.1 superfamily II DNA/RNA helicase [Spirosoma utsteinense]